MADEWDGDTDYDESWDIDEIYDKHEKRERNILETGAKLAFVAGSLYAISRLTRDAGITDEDMIGIPVTPAGTVKPGGLVHLIERVKDPAEKYAEQYAKDLQNGGRYINVGIWGPRDPVTGKKEYLGYNREWKPWFAEGNAEQRYALKDIILNGENRGIWPGRVQKPGSSLGYETITRYETGTVADKIQRNVLQDLSKHFDQRKSRASMIARTETQNIRRIAAMERYKLANVRQVQWICGGGVCEELCSGFCGQIYDIDDVPFAGEKAHPNCRCDLRPVVGLF